MEAMTGAGDDDADDDKWLPGPQKCVKNLPTPSNKSQKHHFPYFWGPGKNNHEKNQTEALGAAVGRV